jgi:very-short-patch-repair endonuclease
MIDQAARARLERWKLSLLDLSAENRLLDMTEGPTTIPLPAVDPAWIAAALAGGAAFTVASDPAVGTEVQRARAAAGARDTGDTGDTGDAGDAEHPDRLRSPLAAPELARRLVAIRRAARSQLADRGVHPLWLGLGLLTWCDAASDAASGAASGEPVLRTAPLALWPVELARAGGGLRLVQAAGVEPRCNRTLGEKLRRDFEVGFPPEGDGGDELDVAALLDAAEAIAATRPGWRLARSAQLGIFAPDKFELWSDLEARGDDLLAHPLVAHLAGSAGVAFDQPSLAARRAVTVVAGGAAPAGATGDLFAPLEADASQLAAIAAAGAGASFVLQGPPGTGTSQTIANLIVHCMAHGKSVLFVTNKRAAIEVVQQRLAEVGLGEFCLELHAHEAVRPHVVAQLGRVLERAFRPVTGPMGDDTRLGELGAALDDHVAALHRVGPFGRSLHDVLSRLVELRATPRAPLAERDAVGLDHSAFEHRRLAVHALATAALPVEPVATHPWRASAMERWPLDGRERAVAALDEADAAVRELACAVQGVASLVPGLITRTRDQLHAVGAMAALAAASPRPGAELLTQLFRARGDEITERIALIRARGTGTLDVPRDPGTFLVLASRHRVLAAEVNERFTDSVAALDAPALWLQLRRWVHRIAPLRFLALRQARAEIRAAATPGMLETDGARITALESVIAERAVGAALVAAAEPAKRWFGELGGHPLGLDLSKIDAAVGWAAELRRAFDAVDVAGGDAGRAAAWRALVAQVAANPAAESPGTGELDRFTRLADAVTRWSAALAALADKTGIDAVTLGAGDDPPAEPLADHLVALGNRIEALRGSLDAMRDWVAFHGARQTARAAGIGPAVTAIERGDLGAAELAPAWERATLLAWADAELAVTPALARFHGAAHHAHVTAFADLDRAALALVRARALVRIAERVPRVTADPSAELATLLHELKRQHGHRPLRRLFGEIATLLPRLAPCLLMSPASVAQVLDPALPRFDVVVFDEASQLPAADALGALARAEAAVVVGDSCQLPPIPHVAESGTHDGDGGDAADGERGAPESLLDACIAAGLPELHLAWHYRSKHEDLIAFANQHYYGDRLQVFPATHRSPELGVAWRRVAGVYDPAGTHRTRRNHVEAEAVVAEVIARLRDPARRSRSIGVVTLARAQQALIEDLLDEARDADPELDGWFEASPAACGEPVLVESLETIQGEVRDVVILSIGYGPDAGGAFPTNLGPLSRPGGERGLNVAITRAREQLLVFSSFAPEDLAPQGGQGVQDLTALLAFARDCGSAARAALAEDAAPASPITAAIARVLVERGFAVHHQVGRGAYKIDLAIVDPNDADRYVLAIEHDGAAYASAPAARDRDRLRSQVLAQLGWRVHRIWSLDWWADPEREIQRAHGAIIAAVAASRQRRKDQPPAGRVPSVEPFDSGRSGAAVPRTGTEPLARTSPRARSTAQPALAAGSGPTGAVASLLDDVAMPIASGSAPVRIAKNTIAIGPYLAAAIPAGRRAPDDLFATRHLGELGKIIEQVLAAEAPMHLGLLARRVAAYFGISRLTQRVTDQVRIALAGRGRWGDEDGVVWRLDQDPDSVPAVRVAGHGALARREIEEVPLSEVASAARIIVERAAGIPANDLVRDAARLLGFARVTELVIERVVLGVRLAVRRELIRIDAGKARLPE